jgi:hypothetical protein
MQSFILITLFCISFLSASYAQDDERFHSIIVRNGDFGTAPRDGFLIGFDCTFACMGGKSRDFGTNDNTLGLFVYSKPRNRWLQIAKVSTEGAEFGKTSPKTLVQQPWDFTGLASKDFVSLPIPSFVPHYPDEIALDETNDVFVLHFDSSNTAESERTTLLIRKKDLTDAFDYYSESKFKRPSTDHSVGAQPTPGY